MSSVPRDKVPAFFAQAVRQRLGAHLKDLRLFGSRARGDARPDSDYDMLVIVDQRSPAIRAAILAIEVDMIDRHEALVTSIVRSESEWVQRQGTPLALNLEVILAERFGQAWQLARTAEGLRLRWVGAEGAILFDTLCEGLTQAHSDQPFTHWDAKREGWTSALGGPLPAPGYSGPRI